MQLNQLTTSLTSISSSLPNARPTSISVSADGLRFVVGSLDGMRVYARTSATSTDSTLIATVLNTNTAADTDAVVAISPDGSTIAVKFEAEAEDVIKIYALNMTSSTSGSLTLQSSMSSAVRGCGESFSFSYDGNILAVGFPGYATTNLQNQLMQNSGLVYIFSRSNGSWVITTTIENPDKGLEDYFGNDVSISNNGLTLAIGAMGANNPSEIRTGIVFIYDLSTNGIVQRIKADDCQAGSCFGSSVALSGDGQRLAIGGTGKDETAYSTSVVYELTTPSKPLVVYKLVNGVWAQDTYSFINYIYESYTQIIDVKMSINSTSMAVIYSQSEMYYGKNRRDYWYCAVYDYDGTQWVKSVVNLTNPNISLGYASKPAAVFIPNFNAESSGDTILLQVVGLTDSFAPTLSDASITAKDQTYSSITLQWTAASDDMSSNSSMLYDVRYSSSNNMSTVSLAESNGTLWQTITGVNSSTLESTISDLAINSTYYFTIIARDAANNKTKYNTISSATLADIAAPIPVTDGAPISYSATKSSATLTWPLATDNVTSGSQIQYALYRVPIFTTGYTGSVSTTESMGTLVMPYTSNVSTYTETGLSPGSLYGYNVIAKDSSGNKVAYSPIGVTTQADDIAPVPSSKSISLSNVTFNGYRLSWKTAVDDFSPAINIYYKVYESASNNISTISTAESNGTLVGQFFGTDTVNQIFNVSGKMQNTSKYYNVIAQDAAGNKVIYNTVLASTLADVDGPTYISQPTVTSDYNSIRVAFSPAQDNLTLSNNIEFALYRLPNFAYIISYIEQVGTLVRNYLASTEDIVVPNLQTGTTYHFALIGRDEAGNKTLYSAFSKATLDDATPPTPGSNGFLSKENVTETGFKISWARASDDVSNSLNLQYAVYQSTVQSDLDSLASIAATNPSYVAAFEPDRTSYTVSFNPTNTYYWTVIVRDERGNMAKYQTISNRNSSDVAAPVPGNLGNINLTPNGYYSIIVQYLQAVDNVTSSSWLQYKIVMSTQNNISTVADAEYYGTTIYDWGQYNYSLSAIVPVPGRFYFFNVLVRDAEGNKAAYVAKAGKSQVDTIPPSINNKTISLVENVMSSPTSVFPTVKIAWQPATDNLTTQGNLKYTVYAAKGNPSMSTVAEIESLQGTKQWVVMGTQLMEQLLSEYVDYFNTQYSVNIVVEDSLGNKSTYNKLTFTTVADTYPPVITNPNISITSRTTNSIKFYWNQASDIQTSNIVYDLYYSLSNNIASVSAIEANGTLIASGTYSVLNVAANNGYTLSNLVDGTAHYINVIAKDAVGNKSCYTMYAVSTLAETTPPTVNAFSLTLGAITDASVVLNWVGATDNKTSSSLLEYAVFYSTSQFTQSVASIESGTMFLNYTPATGSVLLEFVNNATSVVVSGLNRGTRYWFGVVVRDRTGNKSVYAPVNTQTLTDTVPPVVPNNGSITVLQSLWYAIRIAADLSTDNFTPSNALTYRVYMSMSNNITTVNDMISNGAYAGNATVSSVINTVNGVTSLTYSANFQKTGLAENTGYYFNIMVVDAFGNKSAYQPVFAKTSRSQNATPVVGDSGKLNITVAGSGMLSISWTAATDVSGPLDYAVFYATRKTTTVLKNEFPPMTNGLDILSQVSSGLITQSTAFTPGMTSHTITGLEPATEYMINVVVRNSTAIYSAYNASKVWTFTDTTGPVPGLSGVLTTSYINDAGFTVAWAKASDDYSIQTRLRYEARASTQNNISTVDTFKNGIIVMPFTTDVSSATVTGLQSGTQYYVNVMVMDVAGNKSVYQARSVTTAPDITGPTPLSSALTFSQVGKEELRVSWTRASDRSTAQEDIQYALYMGNYPSYLETLNQLDTFAVVMQDYLADTTSAIVTDLVPGARYYFNVVAKDKFGNRTLYTPNFIDTLEDKTPPTPGAGGEILTTSITQTSVSLSWASAVEDLSDKRIEYTIFKSLSNNIDTVENALNNGSTVVYLPDGGNSFTVTGLNPSSTYYFNIIAQDMAGNSAIYKTVSASTIVDTTVPSPGNSGIVTASMVTADSLVLNWTKGTDNITVEGDLQYAIYMSYFDNMLDLSSTLSNGSRIKDFSRNISVVTVDKLQPLTTYYFNVVVRDSFGNMATYNTVSAQTIEDTTGPVPGGGGILSFSAVDKDSMIVSWNPAQDNTSSGVQIQYQLRMAMSNLNIAPDFSTVASTEANGLIVKAYSNTTYALVSGLLSNTNYYFNVIAKDASGNKTVYASSVQKTANDLVEIPTESVEINQPVVIASNKDEIKSLPTVASHPTLSKPSNWKKVHMIYKSTTSKKRVVVVITDFSQMSGQFMSQDTEQFAIHKIIVEDENNNFISVPASAILNAESWSISVT